MTLLLAALPILICWSKPTYGQKQDMVVKLQSLMENNHLIIRKGCSIHHLYQLIKSKLHVRENSFIPCLSPLATVYNA